MQNTGTWNSDLALLFAFLFFLPIVIGSLARLICSMSCSSGVSLQQEPVADFVLENIKLTKTPPKTNKKKNKKKKKKSKNKSTNDLVISDAIGGLVNLGYKRSDARREVSQLCVAKNYNKPEDIIKDIFGKCV